MRIRQLTLFGLLLTIFACNNSNNNQSQTQIESKKNDTIKPKIFLSLSDLLSLIDQDGLNKSTIISYLDSINTNWKFKGADDEEMFFMKINDEKSKEMITYKYKQFIIEYLTYSKNHYLDISREITAAQFKVTNEMKNDYGGQEYQYASDKYNIITKEIPMTEPGEIGFKVFVAQKR